MRPRSIAALAAAAAAVVLWAPPAGAHPLGNLSTNAAAFVSVRPDGVDVAYVVDLAELPTVRERQAIDTDGDDAVSAPEGTAWAAAECARLVDGLRITRGGAIVPLRSTETARLTFPPGQAGLTTLRLVCHGRGTAGGAELTITDTNRTDTTGWREVVTVADGTTLATTLPGTSPSAALTAYPRSGTQRVLDGTATVVGAGPVRTAPLVPDVEATAPQARGVDGLTRRFTDVVGARHLSVGLGLVALLVATVLGALHALAPGHGKSLMAAVALGRSGSTSQVLGIAGTVCITHTAGVLLLGALLWAGQAATPSTALPWLSVSSGLLVGITGCWLLVRRLQGRATGLHHHAHGHSHGDGHAHGDGHVHGQRDGHSHGDGHAHGDGHVHVHGDGHAHGHGDGHVHSHGRSHGDADILGLQHGHADDDLGRRPTGVRGRSVVLLGIAGGLVPTPSALVVLLGATALGRAWFGVTLVLAYGIGMSGALLITGWLIVRLQDRLTARLGGRPWWERAVTIAPVIAALALVGGGALLTVRAMALL